MARGVVLHIGMHKTGSTALQEWMRANPELLAEHGCRFPRGWLQLNKHHELPLTMMRLDRASSPRRRGEEWKQPGWRANVLAQVSIDLMHHLTETTIISAEGLSLLRYDDELAQVSAMFGDAEVVVYRREPEAYLRSLSAFFVKNDIVPSEDVDAYNYLGPAAWHADLDTLLEGWRRWFGKVTVLSYEEAIERDGSIIPSFCRVLGFGSVPASAYEHRANGRDEELVRVEGNRRTTGDAFGVEPADTQVSLP